MVYKQLVIIWYIALQNSINKTNVAVSANWRDCVGIYTYGAQVIFDRYKKRTLQLYSRYTA